MLGPGGRGPDNDGEVVIEVMTRAPEGVGRNLERDLLGWLRDSPCSLSELDSLKPILEDVGKTGSEVCGQPDRILLVCDHRPLSSNSRRTFPST